MEQAQRKPNSVLFSLKELRAVERQRVEQEEQQRQDEEEARLRQEEASRQRQERERLQAVELFYLDEAGDAATCAARAGVSVQAFWQRLSRARAMLADCVRRGAVPGEEEQT